jgi:hypothetical protein
VITVRRLTRDLRGGGLAEELVGDDALSFLGLS